MTAPNVTFLVGWSANHEGSGIMSSHRTFEQGIAEIDTLITDFNESDTYDSMFVLAVSPGCGAGIVVAKYESILKDGGPILGPLHPQLAEFNRTHPWTPFDPFDNEPGPVDPAEVEREERRRAALGECRYRDWRRVL